MTSSALRQPDPTAAPTPAVAGGGEGTAGADPALATIDRVRAQLLDGPPCYTIEEMAEAAGTSITRAREYWQALGFPQPGPGDAIFTEMDLAALRQWVEFSQAEELTHATRQSLIRAQSYHTDRLVLWQVEAVVEQIASAYGLDDTSARLLMLDKLPQLLGPLERQLAYSWRRQMVALLTNTATEVGLKGDEDEQPDAYPLDRSLGFVDMVSYTRNAAQLTSHELAHLVQGFEQVARDVITSRGGRVVKTIGDCVFYVAHSLLTAADIACALVAEIEALPGLLPVRASLVRGRVVSRSGDMFGPPVNLAARIADIAPTNEVLTDAQTAADLLEMDRRGDFQVTASLCTTLRGVGEVECFRVRRAQ